MTSRLRTRIERVERRVMPEPGDKLPLTVFRRFADGQFRTENSRGGRRSLRNYHRCKLRRPGKLGSDNTSLTGPSKCPGSAFQQSDPVALTSFLLLHIKHGSGLIA